MTRASAGFPRFLSFDQSAFETRETLKYLFQRYLPHERWRTRKPPGSALLLSDEELLVLLLGLKIEFGADLETARDIYNSFLQSLDGLPKFDELFENGWFAITWGRISSSIHLSSAIRRQSENFQKAVGALREHRYRKTFSFQEDFQIAPNLQKIVDNFLESPEDLSRIASTRTAWVMARLWEESSHHFPDIKDRLRFWYDRWDLVGRPQFVPSLMWREKDAEEFRRAVFAVLSSDSGMPDWVQMRLNCICQLALDSDSDIEKVEAYIPPLPNTLTERFIWLRSRSLENVTIRLDNRENFYGLVRLLLRDVEAGEHGPAPHPISRSLFELAAESPNLLVTIEKILRTEPVLLADFLIHPPTSALACMIIATYASNTNLRNREIIERDDTSMRLTAFSHAVTILMHFVVQDSLGAADFASFLVWLHEKADRRRKRSRLDGEYDQFLDCLETELGNLSEETLERIAVNFLEKLPGTILGSARFAAALDIITAGGLVDSIDPVPFVTAYIHSIGSDDYSLSAGGISSANAHSLVLIASRADWSGFLKPIDVPTLLSAALDDAENRFTRIDALAKGIRIHIRILCRAIATWEEESPEELLSALEEFVRSGATTHVEKGKVAAFTARFEGDLSDKYRDRPMAVDLGEALRALHGASRERLLKAVLEIDEPMLLAQLLNIVPKNLREPINSRISALSPEAAGETWSLTEMQARIEELISVGAFEAAATFLNVEKGLKTLGKVPGREVWRLQSELRLMWHQRDFDGIKAKAVPAGLEGEEIRDASEVLSYYRALAEVSRPDGNAVEAEKVLKGFHNRRPDSDVYFVNYFSARINLLLSDNLFGRLSIKNNSRAKSLLIDAKRSMAHLANISDESLSIHNANLSLLLLAMGQPEKAHDLLWSTRDADRSERVFAYSAVALYRMGQEASAREILEQAEADFGPTDLIKAVSAQINRSAPLRSQTEFVDTDDVVNRIKGAIHDLSQLSAEKQAMVFKYPPDALGTFLTDEIRSASASIVALVPMMRRVELDACEDDITALLREVLHSRLLRIPWSVPDQSQGGFSAKGNPGERDLLIKRDSAVLAVLEAVVCRHHINSVDISRHFIKLFGYANCRLFYHLTYSYHSIPASVLIEIGKIARENAPDGFKYLGQQELMSESTQPPGFIAQYQSSAGQVQVVFLLLDLQQEVQRQAARSASVHMPRN